MKNRTIFADAYQRRNEKMKIMIVNGDAFVSQEIKTIVLNLGYEVVGVIDSGERAIEMAPKLSPDVILMEKVLPGEIEGTKIAETIMGLVDCAFVFVTGKNGDGVVQKTTNVESHNLLLKPFAPSGIKTSIEIAFHKKQFEHRVGEACSDLIAKLKVRTSELEKANQQLRAIINAPTDSMALLGIEGTIVAGNSILAKRFGMEIDELVGKNAYEILPRELSKARKIKLDRVVKTGKPSQFTDKRGNTIFDNHVYPVFDNAGRVIQLAVYGKDITREVEFVGALENANNHLELKTELLEKSNMALKLMLEKSAENRKEIEEDVLFTLSKMVIPYISKIKKAQISQNVRAYIGILENNIKQVTSPFSKNLSFEYVSLTPKEIQVANLIKDGKSTKEIAEALSISKGTADFYRNNIREKIGLRGKKIRLREHLLSFRKST